MLLLLLSSIAAVVAIDVDIIELVALSKKCQLDFHMKLPTCLAASTNKEI